MCGLCFVHLESRKFPPHHRLNHALVENPFHALTATIGGSP
jgi:hypothetical protein